jgi:hypothetical protein
MVFSWLLNDACQCKTFVNKIREEIAFVKSDTQIEHLLRLIHFYLLKMMLNQTLEK